MSKKIDYSRTHHHGIVVHQKNARQMLACGHETTRSPVVESRSGRLWRCPEGCGLQKARRRRAEKP